LARIFFMNANIKNPTGFSKWESVFVRVVVILLASLWIYSPVFNGDWLWDDDYLITANPVVKSPDGLASFWVEPKTADYFPLTMSWLWLMWKWFGMDSTGYHVAAVLLHALGSCLVWALLRTIGLRGAWLAGLIFVVHPICVESVAWISELKNTFSLPFFLVAGCFFVRFEETRRRIFYWAALLFFLAAMLAKSSVVMFPVVMLLYIWWRRDRIVWRDIWNSAPFFLLAIILGLVTLYFQHGRAIGNEPIPIGGLDSRFAIAGMAIFFYLSKILWPALLLPIYPQWNANPPELVQFLPWSVLSGGLVVFWIRRKTWGRHALLGMGFYLIMLLPVLGFVAMSYMRVGWVADHFLYIPMIGIVALVVAVGFRASDLAGKKWRPLFGVLAALVVGGLAVWSHRYAGIWDNEDKLWSYTLQHNWECWQAHNRIGAREFNRGNVDVAMDHFIEATRLRPDLAETQNNLGTAVLAKKDTKAAIRHFQEAFRLAPDIVAIQSNLARAFILDNQPAVAAELYADLSRRYPQNAVFLCNLGVTLFQAGEKNKAIASFRRALEIDPDLADARENLRAALEEEKNPPLNK
jgi:cytochrome c-type biogenesis protein CcmH/NrfG